MVKTIFDIYNLQFKENKNLRQKRLVLFVFFLYNSGWIGGKEMSFIEEVKQRAKTELKTIILPEATDIRVLKATETVISEGYAKIVLIGN